MKNEIDAWTCCKECGIGYIKFRFHSRDEFEETRKYIGYCYECGGELELWHAVNEEMMPNSKYAVDLSPELDPCDKLPEDKLSFKIPSNKRKELDNWIEEHDKTCTEIKSKMVAIGGRLTYSFTPNGLGVIIEVKCICGCRINLTNIEDW